MKKISWKIIGWSVMSFALLLKAKTALAQEGFEGFDRSGRIKTATKLPDPEGGPRGVALEVISWVLGMLGLVAVIMIIYGGFMWMTAAGNEERITKAKKILRFAIIGLSIILFSYVLVNFIFSQINEATVDEGA